MLLYASERVIGSPELRALCVELWRDWALGPEEGLSALSVDLDLFRPRISSSPRAPRRRASPPPRPMTLRPSEEEAHDDLKLGHQEELGQEEKGDLGFGQEEVGQEEGGDVELGQEEEDDLGAMGPGPSQHPSGALLLSLLELFLRAPGLRGVPPAAIKKVRSALVELP